MRREWKFSLACLAAVAAVAAALAWPCAPRVGAQSQIGGKQKVSADLRQKLGQGGKVNIVIKSAGAWGRTLDDAVKNNNGTVTKSFTNFPLRAVSLPPAADSELIFGSDPGAKVAQVQYS